MPEREILLRLGCHIHKAKLSTIQQSELKSSMLKAFALCRPAGRYTVLPVAENNGRQIVCRNGFTVSSSQFSDLARNAEYLWIGAVTVGMAIVRHIEQSKDMALAAIADATASESADSAMDFLQHYAAQELKKSGLALHSRRFSPGYGDMSLSHQQEIFPLLKLNELGMTLTENNFIIPEKSVTAFAPVYKGNILL